MFARKIAARLRDAAEPSNEYQPTGIPRRAPAEFGRDSQVRNDALF
jgi:hypothetical protein